MGHGNKRHAPTNHPWIERRPVAIHWLPAAALLAAIAGESTRVAGTATTLHLLIAAVRHTRFEASFADLVMANWGLRKFGHFFGYGLLAALVMRGWLRHFLPRSPFSYGAIATRAASVGVLCAGGVATLDEWHQSFLPGRSASIDDVALDTFGAAVFVLLYLLVARARHMQRPITFAFAMCDRPQGTRASARF